jgi:hypothetical protein
VAATAGKPRSARQPLTLNKLLLKGCAAILLRIPAAPGDLE